MNFHAPPIRSARNIRLPPNLSWEILQGRLLLNRDHSLDRPRSLLTCERAPNVISKKRKMHGVTPHLPAKDEFGAFSFFPGTSFWVIFSASIPRVLRK